jgi:hypothetical protein
LGKAEAIVLVLELKICDRACASTAKQITDIV